MKINKEPTKTPFAKPAGLDELIPVYRNYLLKIIYSFMKNDADTEEAYQEVCQKIFRSHNSETGDQFKNWAARIAVNHCIDRKRKRQVETVPFEDELIEASGHIGFSAEEVLIRKETSEAMQKQIDSLPQIYREVIQMHYFSEFSYQEIAEKLELNLRTVETRIYRARKILGESWGRHAL